MLLGRAAMLRRVAESFEGHDQKRVDGVRIGIGRIEAVLAKRAAERQREAAVTARMDRAWERREGCWSCFVRALPLSWWSGPSGFPRG